MKKYGIFVHPGKELTTPRQQNHYKEDVREMVAQIIAVVVCQSYDTYLIDGLIDDLCHNLKNKQLEQQYRSILTLGYTVSLLKLLTAKSLKRNVASNSCHDFRPPLPW